MRTAIRLFLGCFGEVMRCDDAKVMPGPRLMPPQGSCHHDADCIMPDGGAAFAGGGCLPRLSIRLAQRPRLVALLVLASEIYLLSAGIEVVARVVDVRLGVAVGSQ